MAFQHVISFNRKNNVFQEVFHFKSEQNYHKNKEKKYWARQHNTYYVLLSIHQLRAILISQLQPRNIFHLEKLCSCLKETLKQQRPHT